jgi:DNA repair protein RadC
MTWIMHFLMSDQKPSIKEWAADDRPREKLQSLGVHALSDTDLLAILIGTGSGSDSAIDLARQLLSAHDQDLFLLASSSLDQWQKIKGIGLAKATTIAAAIELGRRIRLAEPQKRTRVSSPQMAVELFDHIRRLQQEEFWIASLNVKSEVLDLYAIHRGGLQQVQVDLRLVFARALEKKATQIVVAHNHPSGHPEPSKEDQLITQRIKEIGQLLNIRLADHIILTATSHYSFAQEGLI